MTYLMAYVKYLKTWYRWFGLTTKNQPASCVSDSDAYYEFLGPVAFYKERKELNVWISAAKSLKQRTADKNHHDFVRRFGTWESHADWAKRHARAH
jgi:hypothetical protein